ncbi:MAG TPA: hypothetical protein VM536_01350 [Chloroflexia bacterium]|nr:hypothetical protein [Chloroflexia bacterium]
MYRAYERPLQYPLTLSFKILAFAPQVAVTDSTGMLHFYVRQKLFKLKEAVTVFADEAQQQPLYTLQADRILDFSARYRIADVQGRPLGSVKQQGMKSLVKSHFDVLDGETPVLTIQEENPWIKVLDALLSEVPVLGLFTGYVLNPSYIVARPDGAPMLRLKKQPAFLESRFLIERLGELNGDEERRALLSLLMIVLLERGRG